MAEWEEEIERNFRRMKNLAGMIVGRLSGCDPKPPTPGWPIREIILEAAAGTRYPIVMNFPCGHIPRKRTLLMGVPAKLKTSSRSLTLDAASRS